jgi:hypothetical protein
MTVIPHVPNFMLSAMLQMQDLDGDWKKINWAQVSVDDPAIREAAWFRDGQTPPPSPSTEKEISEMTRE